MANQDMQNDNLFNPSDDFSKKAVEASIKIGLMVLLLSWCFHIAQPFINALVWGIIIAVALYPVHLKLTEILGRREKLSAGMLTFLLLSIILGPCGFLANMAFENIEELADKLRNDTLMVPPPKESIAAWPLIGKPLFNLWQLIASNLEEAVKLYAPQLKTASKWFLSSSVSGLMAVLQFLISVIICGMLLVNGSGGHQLALSIGKRIAGYQGEEWVDLCIATIRGVARGVLGVALIQAFLAGLGFFAVGLPGAGLLTVLCLLLAIVQLPTFVVIFPSILYVFSTDEAWVATIFTIWMLAVGLVDNVLKPFLLGHGLDLPMVVVFIGSIGGMIYSGLIGLFVGAVVLALGYKLFLAWLQE
jgi:predicted PurR-regulated permease PerM